MDAVKTGNIEDHIKVGKLAAAVEMVDRAFKIGCLIDELGQNEFFKLLGRDHIAEVALHRIPRLFRGDIHPGDEGKIKRTNGFDLLIIGDLHLATNFLCEVIYLIGVVVKIVEQVFGAAERRDDVHNASEVGDREANVGVGGETRLHFRYVLPHFALLVKFHRGRIFPIGDELLFIEPNRLLRKLKAAAKAGGKTAGTEVCKVSGDALGKVNGILVSSFECGIIIFGVEPLLLKGCGVAVGRCVWLGVRHIENRTIRIFTLPEFFVFGKHGLMLLLEHFVFPLSV